MAQQLDCLIVGAGFAGLYMLHRVRGLGISVKVVEAASGVGGTWFWNRYPGSACDVDSTDYSYSFDKDLQRDWTWTRRFSPQKEILSYLNHVADRFNLRNDIILNTCVTAAEWIEQAGRWNVTCNTGNNFSVKFLIMATGALSTPKQIDIPGVETFKGETFHTSSWPYNADFTGKRVAVIGTGASGVQVIPEIAKQAKHLTVFQRTPVYAVPAGDKAFTEEETKATKAKLDELKVQARATFYGLFNYNFNPGSAMAVSEEERTAIFEKGWNGGGLALAACFGDQVLNPESNEQLSNFCRNKIREMIKDPNVCEDLIPDYGMLTKRAALGYGYYETFNLPHVTLVNLRKTPMVEVTPKGIKTTTTEHELDCIVYATGFDALTGALTKIDIRGKNNETVKQHWSQAITSYMGLALNNFPNMFTITGPGSPSVISNMVFSIEEHVDWISNCLDYLTKNNIKVIEATKQAELEWMGTVNYIANMTLFPKTQHSWYNGGNVPGKAQGFLVYLGGFGPYGQQIREVAAAKYKGFVLTENLPQPSPRQVNKAPMNSPTRGRAANNNNNNNNANSGDPANARVQTVPQRRCILL